MCYVAAGFNPAQLQKAKPHMCLLLLLASIGTAEYMRNSQYSCCCYWQAEVLRKVPRSFLKAYLVDAGAETIEGLREALAWSISLGPLAHATEAGLHVEQRSHS